VAGRGRGPAGSCRSFARLTIGADGLRSVVARRSDGAGTGRLSGWRSSPTGGVAGLEDTPRCTSARRDTQTQPHRARPDQRGPCRAGRAAGPGRSRVLFDRLDEFPVSAAAFVAPARATCSSPVRSPRGPDASWLRLPADRRCRRILRSVHRTGHLLGAPGRGAGRGRRDSGPSGRRGRSGRALPLCRRAPRYGGESGPLSG
jgi:2-polyprenyl-6-methoxyphenol hydroxylase-like FAD-dependent oxidoreductase